MLTKYVQIGFVLAGIITWIILGDFFSYLFETFMPDYNFHLIGEGFKLSDLLGLFSGVGVWLYLLFNEKINTWGKEVAVELSKVNWPSKKDVKNSTIVVIIFSLVVAILLGLFDYIWGLITSFIYKV